MSTIGTPRRYYLLKRQACASRLEWDLAGAYRAKQEAEAGVALPLAFPYLTDLASLGYTTVADLTGSDEYELVGAGLSHRKARAVLTALAEL